jgi:predicted nucleic acid-binding protein
MSTTAQKIVIDTNVFITILSKKGDARWIFDILMEYWEVLADKTNPEIALNVVDFLMTHPYVEFVNVYIRWNLIEIDQDDNKFADCCLAGNADCLVSNDHHMQTLKKLGFPKITILTVDEFTRLSRDLK